MILSDATIRELIKEGKLRVEPFREESLQSSSLDLTLGSELVLYATECIDIKDPRVPIQKVLIPDEGFLIPPKDFLLATTEEYIKLPEDITAFVEGRSSLGRLGLFIENAGWVDAGFEGQITLELYNANSCPIRIYRGIRICQIVLAKLDRKAERPYRGKYWGQKGATPSKIYMDFQK
ncbi:MAG: dCTP deaminase [Acidobacteria bacterium]|nr:MAG: dCTP deaminase [Acidobacteriota bacterium]